MTRALGALAAALWLAAPAAAQQPPAAPAPPGATGASPYDPAILSACLSIRSGPRDRAGCVGVATSRCLDALPPVAEDDAFSACYVAEEAQWTERLEGSLALYRDNLQASDTAEGSGTGRVDRLAEAQDAWERYRNADCGLHYRVAEGGGSEVLAEAACRLDRVAERALALEQVLQRMEGP